MKKLIRILTFGLMVVLLAVPALARFSATPVTARVQDEEKNALYQKVLDNYKTNQPVAYEAAKEYLQKYPDSDQAIIDYLKNFVAKYEKGKRQADFEKLLIDKKWAEGFNVGKAMAAEQPEDLKTHLNTAWAGWQLALSGNNANNAEVGAVTLKTIQLIDAGKTLEAGKPYPEKEKREALGWLNYSLGIYSLRDNKPSEASAHFIKALSLDSPTKSSPNAYIQLATAYEAEYGRLQTEYDNRFKGQPETEESKAALLQVKQFLEPMIDAYARAVAYSGETPAFQQVKTAAKQRLEELYKFSKGSTDGLDALIASVKTKPLPPQPSATFAPAAPATTSAPTATETNPASGTAKGASTNPTPTPTPATTTGKPNGNLQTSPASKKPGTAQAGSVSTTPASTQAGTPSNHPTRK